MWPIPSEHYSADTSLTAEEAPGFVERFLSNSGTGFAGEVTSRGFKLTRNLIITNPARPYVFGRFVPSGGGLRIDVRLTMSWGEVISLAAFNAAFTYLIIKSVVGRAGVSVGPMWFGIVSLVACNLMTVAGWKMEAGGARKFIRALLQEARALSNNGIQRTRK